MKGSNKRINFIKDYFREEKISFRSWPVFIVMRIAFAALIIFTFNVQWCMMVMGAVFSIGFIQNTEAEKIIPLTDEELKQKRFVRVNMVWLRYLILGIIGYIVTLNLTGFQNVRELIMMRPCMYFAFFILQMVTIYQTMLEQMIDNSSSKRFTLKQPIEKYIFNSIPSIIFFVYGVSSIQNTGKGFFFTGQEWPHVLVMLIGALLSIIYTIIQYKRWKIEDFRPELINIKAAKGGMA